MGEQILTQVEVDALLKGLSNGDIKTEGEQAVEAESIRPYDFRKQERVIRSKMPTLEMINEKVSRDLRATVFNILRKSVDVSHEGIESMKYEDFLKNLHVPSSLNIFQMSPLRGQGILAIDPNLVFFIVDSYFGGTGRFHTRIEGRDFTKVEQIVIQKVVDGILDVLKQEWGAVYPLDIAHLRTEMNPQFVNIIAPTELVIISTFRMEIETASEKFYICLPYSTLEPIKDLLFGILVADAGQGDKRWKNALIREFGEVKIGLSSKLGKARIKVSELLNLAEGDIIQLDKKIREPVEILVEGRTRFLGRPGVFDKNYALEILSVVNERG